MKSSRQPAVRVAVDDCQQVTILHVVPPLLDKVLLSVDSDVLGRCLSTVRCIMSAGVALGDVTARKILQLMPGVQIVQGKYGKRRT